MLNIRSKRLYLTIILAEIIAMEGLYGLGVEHPKLLSMQLPARLQIASDCAGWPNTVYCEPVKSKVTARW